MSLFFRSAQDPWERLRALGAIDASMTTTFDGRVELTATMVDGRTVTVTGSDSPDMLATLVERLKDPPKPREPDATVKGKALGFRSWKLSGYELLSANHAFGGWRIGEPTEATCKPGLSATSDHQHDAPAHNCHCGLYGLHAPEFMSRWHQDEPLMVHGAVLGWGRMEVHHEGWRAQYAQPVMLAFDGDRQPYNHCERVKAMGSELGLPVAEWPEFEAQARKLAEPVAQEHRPAAPTPSPWSTAPVNIQQYGAFARGGYMPGATMGYPIASAIGRPPAYRSLCHTCGYSIFGGWAGRCPNCGS